MGGRVEEVDLSESGVGRVRRRRIPCLLYLPPPADEEEPVFMADEEEPVFMALAWH